jgi:YqaJ-like viral recombinase domain
MLTIGSSDVPAILSGKLWDVWMRLHHPEKVSRGDLPEFERGKRLEPVLANWYTEEYDRPLRKCETLFHPNYPWMRATPDYEDELEGAYVEMKSKHWVSAPSQCEIEFEFQVRWQMALGQKRQGYVWAWYMKDGKPVRWSFPRDLDFERRMLAIVIDFYERFVKEKKEPPPEMSESYGTYLNYLPAAEEGLEVDGDHPIAILGERLRRWKLLEGLAKRKYQEGLVALKSAMRSLGWIKGEFGRATFKPVKGATKRDWEQIARWLGVVLMDYMPKKKAEAIFNGIVAKYTQNGQNYRRLNPRWAKLPPGDVDALILARLEDAPATPAAEPQLRS